MEEQQAGTAVAEAQVGPASEQVAQDLSQGIPPLGQNQDKALASKPAPGDFGGSGPIVQVFELPEAERSGIEALAMTENESNIRLDCANTRKRLARDVGDAEAAIIEFRNIVNLGRERDAGRLRVDAELRRAIPEIPLGGRVYLDIPEFTVRWYNET